METAMGLQCTPKLFSEKSTVEHVVSFTNPDLLYNLQGVTWSGYNIYRNPSQPWLNSHNNLTMHSWSFSEETDCMISQAPLIFSISEDAEGYLSERTHLKKDTFDICGRVAEFVVDNDLSAIGTISIFQEDELVPKLFIKYTIANKTYEEILKLWDAACAKIAESIPIDSLKEIAVVFDQI